MGSLVNCYVVGRSLCYMLRRIPLSLRIEDENSDFYSSFIVAKRNNRELTDLILDLLRLYYDKDEIKLALEEYRSEKNPYAKVQADLQRIAQEHNKYNVAADILSDVSRNEKKKYEENLSKTSEEDEQEKLRLMEESIAVKVNEKVEEQVTTIMPKLVELIRKEVVNSMTGVGSNNGSVMSIVGEVVNTAHSSEGVIPNKSVDMPERHPMVPQNVETVQPVIQPVKPVIVPQPPVMVSEGDKETSDGEPVKRKRKPASFSKLMGSME